METEGSMRLHCPACDHTWDTPSFIGMEVGAALARMKAEFTCPSCGNNSRAKAKRVNFAATRAAPSRKEQP